MTSSIATDRRTIWFIALLMCGVTGCGLFETRDPEPPASGSSTFVPPTSPDLVLSNLEYSVSEKNTENYIRCLADTVNSGVRFLFLPTAAAAGRYASTFSGWTVQSERSYFAALVAFTGSAATSRLTFSGAFVVLASDSAVYEGSYDLLFRHGVPGVTENVKGNVQFVLRTDRSSIWSITRWTDIPHTDQTSWSEWKGRFAN
ncbi:MAG: hypothetical protein M5R41_14740 [Bacteroidia bacterium]|nr:hypothetical protein [Bacteroidia bacterium]